jgi:hypothetical protein
MSEKRKRYSAAFKARVALEAIKGQRRGQLTKRKIEHAGKNTSLKYGHLITMPTEHATHRFYPWVSA